MTIRTVRPIHLAFGFLTLCWGCGSGTDNLTGATVASAATGTYQAVDASGRKTSGVAVTCQADGAQCNFDHGTTTCTLTISQETVVGGHDEISGCTAFDGTTSAPGRRTRHYEDTFLVTTAETTHLHGQCGPRIDSSTASQQQLVSSRLVSDVCEAI